jgi:hypothetical protein
MSGSEYPSRAGRFTALAALVASATLFVGALFGIASIDPNADAASPAGGPGIHNVSMPDKGSAAKHDRRDCPFKHRDRAPHNGDGQPGGVES